MIRLALLGAVALAFVTLIAAVYKYRGDSIEYRAEAARVTGELNKAVALNLEQQREVARMQRQAALDAQLAADLQDDLNAANASTLALATNLSKLKSENADVETFLDLRVPVPLQRMYDRP